MSQPHATDSGAVHLLQHAFQSFDQAAATLQESYRALTDRIERLDLELATSNETLRLKLKENEDLRLHLTAVLESLTTGVIVADELGTIIRCNEAAERLLGVSRDALLGRPLNGCLVERGLDPDAYPLFTPSGIPVSMSQATLRNGAGGDAGRIVLFQDLSTVRRLEERVQRRDRLAAMGEMVGHIAHEIRNPLGSVELFASMLRQDLSHDATLKRYTDHISLAVESMDRLLSNLLFYTKPSRPRADWHAPELIVRDALTLASHATTRGGLEVRLELDPTVSMLWCDAAQIKQVLVNLILNAVQAMPEGGTITIGVRLDQDRQPRSMRLTVSDTGSGIAPEQLSRIFDPFFTTREEGTGLGLAIAHAIVEGHGGRLEVESQLRVGTRFTIVLPATTTAGAARAGDQPLHRQHRQPR
ncbi:MAG TPA: ATP-binding protein [Nitrospirales bacterium]|nr:ATP-binding protein [Nitrospirales bacterium]